MSKRNSLIMALLTSALGIFGGYRLRVLAEGAPTQGTLFYSGTLEQDGAAANGEYTVTLALYDAATGGEALCEVEGDADVESGRFRIDASGCADAVREEPDVWAGVSFEGNDGVTRTLEGRSKIGAVPYALEADHAVNASNAAGALASSLQALTASVQALEQGRGPSQASAFHAVAKQAQSIPTDGWAYVIFDQEDFDLGGEYEPQNGTFTAKSGGYYEFSCIVAWASNPGVSGLWEASLHLNGFEHFYNGHESSGNSVTRSIHGVMKLAPGDTVKCAGLQSAASQPINVDHNYTTFEGRKFATP